MDLDNPSYFSVITDQHQHHQQNFFFPNNPPTECCFSASSTTLPKKRSNRPSTCLQSQDSTCEALIMGQPRLSDIAPDLTSKRAAAAAAAAAASSTSTSTRSTVSEDVHEPEPEFFSDDVFLNYETARYYTNTNYAIGGGRQRRHSIGTFMSNNSGSGCQVNKNVGVADASLKSCTVGDDFVEKSLLVRHASYPNQKHQGRYRLPRGGIKSSRVNTTAMDDILIVSLKASEGAARWVNYFTSYFIQIAKQANRKPFKIQSQSVEECCSYETLNAGPTLGVKLQLIVVCPALLEYIAENRDKCKKMGELFLTDRTLALLLGVADTDLTEVHGKILPGYFQWQRLSVGQDQDEDFTKEFMGQAMAILSRVWKKQCSVAHQEKSCFSVSPKKIRQGQNSVLVLLTQPLQKEDVIKVSIESNQELFEVTAVKRRNPYTLKISVPAALTKITAIVNVVVEKNGSIMGSRPIKCESRSRELEQILHLADNPIEFMCQTLGLSPANRENLDNWLLQTFQRNLPAHFSLLANHDTPFAAAVQAHKHSHEEFPTLLHFAAKFGFEKLALQLLDCPGADIAYDMRNVYDKDPVDIAELNGHTELVNTLKGYMNMNEFTSVYEKLKEMSLHTSKMADVDENCYLTPRNFEELYKICPPPRPVLPQPEQTSTSFSRNFINPSLITPNGYMPMEPSLILEHEEPRSLPKPTISSTIPKTLQNHPNLDLVPEEDKLQELLEIIYDFKNNIHPIAQVEKLVEEWKNRNDVQKSFQEKQEKLNELRGRYEKMQQEIKSSGKIKSSPFERFKKMFRPEKTRGDKHQQKNISVPVLTESSGGGGGAKTVARPTSSLSTASSVSSGRMSTISGSSLGDSGTHSDNEDRKNNFLGSLTEEKYQQIVTKMIVENHPPLPILKKSPTNKPKHFATIQKKPVVSVSSPPNCEEHYILFPPSGLPIPGVEDQIVSGQSEYMNVTIPAAISRSNSHEASSESHEHDYMNFKAVK